MFDSTWDTTSLLSLRQEVQRRLGDTTLTADQNRVWTDDEVDGFIEAGIRDFSIQAQTNFEMRYLEDLPRLFNYHFAWEKDYFTAPASIYQDAQFHFEWEKDYYQGPATHGPAQLQYPDERDSFAVGTSPEIPATEPLPEDLYDVDRVQWDGRKITTQNTRQLKYKDNNFETIKGLVFGYLQDRDGLRTIRKFRKPMGLGNYYPVVPASIHPYFGTFKGTTDLMDEEVAQQTAQMTIDGWGIVTTTVYAPLCLFGEFSPGNSQNGVQNFLATTGITGLSEFVNDTVVSRGGFGVLRRLPGYFPANGARGIVRRVSQDFHNMRVEYWRRPKIPSDQAQPILEIPRYMLRYIRHYALWRALNKRGPGQDLKLAQHYRERYDQGIARTRMRINHAAGSKLQRLGGSNVRGVLPAKPYPRNPRNI